jgi:hypothetical protein
MLAAGAVSNTGVRLGSFQDRMQDEVAKLCEQLGIPQTDKSDYGGELCKLAQSSECREINDSQFNFLSEVKEVAQERALSIEATGCMQKVRSVAWKKLEGCMSDESIGSTSTDVLNKFEDLKPTPRAGAAFMITCKMSEMGD